MIMIIFVVDMHEILSKKNEEKNGTKIIPDKKNTSK